MFKNKVLISTTLIALSGCVTDGLTSASKQTNDPIAESKSANLIRLSKSSIAGGDTGSAINLLRQGIVSNPKDTNLYIELSDIYTRQNRFDDAISVLEAGREQNKGNAVILRKLGNMYLLAEQPEKALVIFDEGMDANPKDPLLLSSRGVALDMTKQQGEARKSYQAALNADGSNISALNNLAMSYILSGELNSAKNALEIASEKPDAPAQVRQNLAFVYALQGDGEKARKLSLKDLTEKQMRENLEVYKKLSSYFIAEDNTGTAPETLSKTESVKTESVKVEQMHVEPVKTEPKKTESAKAASEKSESKKQEAKAEDKNDENPVIAFFTRQDKQTQKVETLSSSLQPTTNKPIEQAVKPQETTTDNSKSKSANLIAPELAEPEKKEPAKTAATEEEKVNEGDGSDGKIKSAFGGAFSKVKGFIADNGNSQQAEPEKLLGKMSPAAGGTAFPTTTKPVEPVKPEVSKPEATKPESVESNKPQSSSTSESKKIIEESKDSKEAKKEKQTEATKQEKAGKSEKAESATKESGKNESSKTVKSNSNKNLYISLGKFADESEAKSKWKQSQKKSKILNEYGFLTKDTGSKKDLLVGPIKSPEQLSGLKLSLDKAQIKCNTVDY